MESTTGRRQSQICFDLRQLCLNGTEAVDQAYMVRLGQIESDDKGTPGVSRGRKTTGLLFQDDGRASELDAASASENE